MPTAARLSTMAAQYSLPRRARVLTSVRAETSTGDGLAAASILSRHHAHERRELCCRLQPGKLMQPHTQLSVLQHVHMQSA